MSEKFRVLCFGDSNTWGYISGSNHLRYGESERWTKLLQQQIREYEIIEEGLNSRTLFSEDNRPGKEGRNGWTYLKPCLDTHDRLDIVILMLGTNELKAGFNNSASDIVKMIDKYVEFLQKYKSQIDKSTPKLIISGLPPVNELSDYCKKKGKYKGAGEKSRELNSMLKSYCIAKKITYVDNSDLQTGIDGVHLTSDSHKLLAEKLAKIIKEIKKKRSH